MRRRAALFAGADWGCDLFVCIMTRLVHGYNGKQLWCPEQHHKGRFVIWQLSGGRSTVAEYCKGNVRGDWKQMCLASRRIRGLRDAALTRLAINNKSQRMNMREQETSEYCVLPWYWVLSKALFSISMISVVGLTLRGCSNSMLPFCSSFL